MLFVLYFCLFSVQNPEILSNPMPQNQINGVDETSNVSVGFDIWFQISAFRGELQSYNLFLLNIDFYWLRRNFLSFFLQKLPWFWFIFHMEQNLTQKVQNLRCLIWLGGGGLTPNETLSHSNGKFVFDHGPNQRDHPPTHNF